jgi:ribosome-binding ATPase YchF (GTP1/OBG family)
MKVYIFISSHYIKFSLLSNSGSMLIGITGAPSKGKSTFFSAVSMVDVPISPRPFTTIEPNKGVTAVTVDCPDKQLGIKCNPKYSICKDGKRQVPINIIDLAGLVPGAHQGKGLGNKFLDSVRNADALIQIVDVSGKTDLEGNFTEFNDPASEVEFLTQEIGFWIEGIIKRSWSKIQNRNLDAIVSTLTGLNISKKDIEEIIQDLGLSSERILWNESEIHDFAFAIKDKCFPIVIAANKIDYPEAKENLKKLKEKFPDKPIFGTYADGELALRKAAKAGIIEYHPGYKDFKIVKDVNEKQKEALEKIRKVMKENDGTGVQQVLDYAVFNLLNLIVVYPVSDEHKFTDNFGNVLPDAILIKKGTTTIQLAEKIHSDLAKNFLYGIDAKKKIRISKDYILNNGDIVKIVSAAK